MTNKDTVNQYYSAKTSYQGKSVPVEYEAERFSGLLGKYRYRREQNAVKALVDVLPDNSIILDCPCGNGRWWPVLARRAKKIIATDISEDMLEYAEQQKNKLKISIEVKKADAEDLPFEDGSVDYVFSHALTKHLPIPVQYRVLAEFSRVARKGVISSFGVFTHFNYEIWKHRHLEESYPVLPEELQWMAESAGLRIVKMKKCTTPLGVERTVLFEKKM